MSSDTGGQGQGTEERIKTQEALPWSQDRDRLPPLILYNSLPFINRETDAQRGDTCCPRSRSPEGAEMGFDPRSIFSLHDASWGCKALEPNFSTAYNDIGKSSCASFIHPFIHSIIGWFIHSLIYSKTEPLLTQGSVLGTRWARWSKETQNKWCRF